MALFSLKLLNANFICSIRFRLVSLSYESNAQPRVSRRDHTVSIHFKHSIFRVQYSRALTWTYLVSLWRVQIYRAAAPPAKWAEWFPPATGRTRWATAEWICLMRPAKDRVKDGACFSQVHLQLVLLPYLGTWQVIWEIRFQVSGKLKNQPQLLTLPCTSIAGDLSLCVSLHRYEYIFICKFLWHLVNDLNLFKFTVNESLLYSERH